MVEKGQDAPQRGGFAGARAAGEQEHLPLGGGPNGFSLEGGVGDALVFLDFFEQLVQVLRGTEGFSVHSQQVVGDVDLAIIELGQVAGVLPRDALTHDLSVFQEGGETRFQRLRLGVQQALGGGHELGVGKEHMPVFQVVGEGVEQTGLQAHRVPRVDAQLQGQLVHRGEGDIERVFQEQVGVVAQDRQRQVPVPPVEGHPNL